jgi:NAD(P)-dependent dehydrogenase (short-subunit alcohol dehydrogenase family)
MRIEGTSAVITGAASGLGAAVAVALAAAGGRVSILDLDRRAGQERADQVNGHFAQLDVSDADSVRRAFSSAEAANGPVRILVNCAGVAGPARLVGRKDGEDPIEAFRRTISINLVGTFNAIACFSKRLAEEALIGEERGIIVNTASIAAFDGQIGQTAYAASKGGIVSMTLPLARELARHAIRVMTITPGIFGTPMLKGLPADVQDSLGKQVPFPSRLGAPEEYAQLVTSVIANPMLNGEVIRLDGALRMAPK